jgi:20S proteasome subunit beta 2
MDEKEAIDMVDEAIQAGIFNDLGSGSNVDICVISMKTGVRMLRNYRTPNERVFRAAIPGFKYPKGSTEWLTETRRIFKTRVDVREEAAPAAAAAAAAAAAPASSSSMDTKA